MTRSLPTVFTRICLPLIIAAAVAPAGYLAAQVERQMERLDRGVVAVPRPEGGAFVSWRMLGTDPANIAFDLHRSLPDEAPQRLNETPIDRVTYFIDADLPGGVAASYTVAPAGSDTPEEAFTLDPTLPYIRIPLQTPEGYTPNDASVGDLDGDGQYELVLHQVGRGRDNSQAGVTTSPVIEAYEFDGTLLWRIDLGRNIREGAHYTQFMVYDRYLAAIAYLQGARPSLVMARGYYTRSVLAAWDYRDGRLTHRWTFDSDDGTPGNETYRGQGNHNLSVGDVDGDGRDEIIYGAAVIDDDGRGLYSTGLGHGDALHFGDLDPARPGLEVFNIQERFDDAGANFRDAATGEVLRGLVGRRPAEGTPGPERRV